MADPHALKIADPHAHDAPPVTTLTPVNPHWLDDSIITLARVRHAASPPPVGAGPLQEATCVQLCTSRPGGWYDSAQYQAA
jgi:hypothetical protein